jgi:hypothetical protein
VPLLTGPAYEIQYKTPPPGRMSVYPGGINQPLPGTVSGQPTTSPAAGPPATGAGTGQPGTGTSVSQPTDGAAAAAGATDADPFGRFLTPPVQTPNR